MSKIEDDLLNTIKQSIKNAEIKRQILEKLQHFEDLMYDEMELLVKNFYKIGIIDGIRLEKEIKEILKKLKS